MTRSRPLRLRVQAPAKPRPALLRAAIADRLAGRPAVGPAEDAVARAVADAVSQVRRERPWR
jgi:formaldehyde-activating enzyme involved in methanogenesis